MSERGMGAERVCRERMEALARTAEALEAKNELSWDCGAKIGSLLDIELAQLTDRPTSGYHPPFTPPNCDVVRRYLEDVSSHWASVVAAGDVLTRPV